jgi:hypothetical protein
MITNAGQCYMVVSGGNTTSGTVSNTAPTHTGLLDTDDVTLDGIRWRCLGPLGAMSSDPKCWIWAAIGDAPHSLVVDANPETNIGWPQTGQDNPNEINTQTAWYDISDPYLFNVYSGVRPYVDQSTITSYPNPAWTASSDGVNVVERLAKAVYTKGPWGCKPHVANQYRNALPSDRLLQQWFDVLRNR